MPVNGAQGPSDAARTFLAGGGEAGALLRAKDWSGHQLGLPETWPESLRSSVSICLNTNFPIAIYWGPEAILIYNDAWRPIVGNKHPRALGQSGREVWSEIWDVVGPVFETVHKTGQGSFQSDAMLLMHRHGYTEECYFDYTFSPIRGQSGRVEGIFNAVSETTFRVLSERRGRLLRELAARVTAEKSVEGVCGAVSSAVESDAADVPFMLLYLIDGSGARLASSTGISHDHPAARHTIDFTGSDDSHWGVGAAAINRVERTVQLDGRGPSGMPPIKAGPWPDPVTQAIVLPIEVAGRNETAAVLVLGVSVRRELDAAYRDFFKGIGGHLAIALGTANAYEEAKSRAEALAELDRAKTTFFSNVSHELRTPLTLILGPLRDALSNTYGQLPPQAESDLTVAHRNAQRLLKLVNTLLDFTRIEAGRVQASYQPIDVGAFTVELASSFQSAIEKSGLRFVIDCPSTHERVYVDPEMWEKIVLNLISNAFKYTFHGEIRVSVHMHRREVELAVTDTGTGIPPEAVPRLFDRFFRVEGAQGRTHEGTGIGLALVAELAKLHGGTVRATSELGKGSTFTVTLPLGSAHLPREHVLSQAAAAPAAARANAYLDEASAWIEDVGSAAPLQPERQSNPDPGAARPTLVLADDNADMRGYIERLLSRRYRVLSVSNGEEALDVIRQENVDLLLTDVMMPKLDGFGLVKAIRGDPELSSLPIIVLSARAGEEAKIEGLRQGADEYLIKPFSARELLASVESRLELSNMRRERTLADRALAEARRRTESALLAGDVGTYYWDIGKDLIYGDKNFVRIFGILRSENDALPLSELFRAIHPDDQAEVAARIRSTLDGNTPYEAEYRVLRSGGERWIVARGTVERDADGLPIGWAGAIMDITELKRAKSQLESSEQRRWLALDAAELGSWNIDPRTNTLIVDERFLEIFTGGSEPITYEQAFACIHPDDREMVRAKVALATMPPNPAPYVAEYRVVHPDGSVRWVYGKGRVSFSGRGRDRTIVSFDGTIADISDRKAAEEKYRRLAENLEAQVEQRTSELEASHRQLRISERMASLGTLSAGLGHDMGNLLVPVRVRLESLANANLPEELKRDVEAIQTSAEYLRKLSSGLRLLALDPMRGPASDSTDLASWWEEAEPMLRSVLARGLLIEARMPRESLTVRMSKPALTQAIFNLVQNASDAMRSRESGRITVFAEGGDDSVRIGVSDDGPGMTADTKMRCMEPFFTTKARDISTGLGLALVYGLVQETGGAIAIDTTLGEGTTFTLTLPGGKTGSEAVGSRKTAAIEIQDSRMRAIVIAELRAHALTVLDDAAAADLVVLDDPSRLNRQLMTNGRQVIFLGTGPANDGVLAIGRRPTVQVLRHAIKSALNSMDKRSGKKGHE